VLSSIFDSAFTIVLVLAILVVLVVIHELGHFVVARRAGVRVHEFGIGFPPRAKIIGRDKETIYTLNWLPLGGFVRLEGEEGDSDDPRAFVNQKLRTRLAILFAGVGMNILLAWLIFTLIAGFADPVTTVQLGCVQPGSPAAQIGLVGGRVISTDANGVSICETDGDTILAIDGKRFPTFDDTEGDAPLGALRAAAGSSVVLTVRHRDGSVEDKTVTLRVPTPTEGALGISSFALPRSESIQHDPIEAIAIGARRTVGASTLILKSLGDLVTNAANLTNPPVSGPIGIVNAVGVVRTELPPVFMLWLIGLLSANLAVVNVLPLPPLDGGRIFISILQALTRNRLNPAFERAVYLVGFLALMGFLVWISYFDIQRLGSG
jgi:regulator of sigma E protease